MARACLVAAKRIVNTLPLSLIQLLRKIARKCVCFFLFFPYNYDVTIFFSKLDLLRVRFAICAASPRFCAAAPHAFGPLQDHAEWLSRR